MKRGGEKVPLVGPAPSKHLPARAYSCLGDPQVGVVKPESVRHYRRRPVLQETALACVRQKNLTALTNLLADVCPVDDDDTKENPADFPLPADHWVNSPTGKEGDYKTLLQLALEADSVDLGRTSEEKEHFCVSY